MAIAIKIPGTDVPLGRSRRPQYVSPATKSISIVMTPASGGSPIGIEQNLTIGSPGCTQPLGQPLTCIVSVPVAPGTYQSVFTTYDSAFTSIPASVPLPIVSPGNVLSVNGPTSIVVQPGANNTFNAVLNGVPTALVVSPIDPQYVGGDVGGLTVAPWHGGRITVTATDAANDYIVGTGIPSIAVNAPGYAISTPDPASPNVFTLPAGALPSALSIVATQGSTTISASVPLVAPSPAIRAGSTLALPAHATGTVTIDELGLPTYRVTSTNAGAAAVAVDSTCTTCAANRQTRFTLTTGGDAVDAITFADNAGRSVTLNLTVGSPAATGATLVIPSGRQLSEYPIGSVATALTMGPDEALWYIVGATGHVGTISGAVMAETALTSTPAASAPADITTGGDGRLWITLSGTGQLAAMTPAREVTYYDVGAQSQPTYLLHRPYSMAVNGVWFTSANSYVDASGAQHNAGIKFADFAGRLSNQPQIGPRDAFGFGSSPLSHWNSFAGDTILTLNLFAFDPRTLNGRAVPTFGTPTAISPETSCYLAADRNVAGIGFGVSQQYPIWTEAPIAAGAGLHAVAETGAGDCWFTETNADRIGRLTLIRSVDANRMLTLKPSLVEYALPGRKPTAITVASDGSVWFVESGTSSIGKLSL